MFAPHRHRALASLLACAIASSSVAFPVLADGKDKAQAQVLFKQGIKLMKEKKFSEACPKFEDSFKLDAQDGTQQQLAACYQELGLWATSYALWQHVLERAQKTENKVRVQNAQTAIAEIEPKLSHLTVTVPAETQTASLKLELDEKELSQSIWNTSMPIDPGPHVVRATAPDHKPFEAKITVGLSPEEKTVTVPRLESTNPPPPVAATAPAPTAVPATKVDVAPSPQPIEESKSKKSLAIGAFVAGGAFLGFAVGSRLKFGSEKDSYFSGCAQQTTPTCDDPSGRSRVRTWETLSFVSGGIALAAIGVGVVLLATDKEKKTTALVGSPTVGGASLQLTTTF